MSFFDRLQEVVPHTGRAWLEAVGIAVVLAVLIFVVLPRLVKPRVLRWAIAVGLLFVAAWLTVLPVFFDKRVDTVFGPENGHLAKDLEKLFSDGSSVSV